MSVTTDVRAGKNRTRPTNAFQISVHVRMAFSGLNMPACTVLFGYVRLFNVDSSTVFYLDRRLFTVVDSNICFKAFVGGLCADFYYRSHKQAR